MKTCANSTYPKVAVQWLNQALCFYQSFCLVDSEVLRNARQLLASTVTSNLEKNALNENHITYIFNISKLTDFWAELC